MTPLPDAIQRLQPPAHVCSVYSNQAEQFASAIPFLQVGIDRGERCVYIAEDEAQFGPVLAALKKAGVPADKAIKSGALVFATEHLAYFRDGRFDPEKILKFWRREKAAVLRGGYTGLRATAEMDWVMRGGAGVERWLEYESMLTNALAETGCLALCQYDRRVCSPSVILKSIRTHPVVIVGDTACENFYFVPPEEFFARDFNRHEMERRLRNLRERAIHDLKLFRALIDQSSDAIEVVDPGSLCFLDVNEKACRDLGYTREELLKLSVFDIDPAMDLVTVTKVKDDLMKAGSLTLESTHRRKDGTIFPVEVNLKHVCLDRNYVVNIARDVSERRGLETALREREDRYRDLVEHSCDLICTHDLEGRLLSVNEVPARILGYSRAEILRTPMRDMIPPQWRHLFDEYLAKIQRDGSVDGLLAVLTKTGERRIWEFHNTLRTEGVRKPIVRGIAHDVTEQKRVEKALRSSEEKFSKAFRSSPIGMAIITFPGRMLMDVNESWQRLTGLSREETVGRTCMDLGLAVQSPSGPAIEELRATRRVRNAEVEWRSRAGETRITLYSAEPLEIGGKECLLAVYEDITQRKVAERRLLKSEEKFSKAFRSSPEIISISAMIDGRFIEANEAFERQTGYTRSEVIGRTDAELGLWPDLQGRQQLGAELARLGRVRDQEVHLRTRSGQLRTLLVSIEIIELEGEACALAVGQDITALKEAEDQLRGLSGRMMGLQEEERRRIARELHDSTAQELTGLRMGLGVIKRSAKKLDRKAMQALTECQKLAESAAREIRTLSYLLHPPLLDDFGLVFALRGYIHGFTKRSGLRVKLDADPQLEQVRLPQELETNLFRIVQEGLTNIRHHSGSSSATITLKQENGEITLRIRDRGRGISAAVAKSIGQGDFSALGVGLSGMRERVRQMGGQFQVKTGDTGTSVTVALPLNGGVAPPGHALSLTASGND